MTIQFTLHFSSFFRHFSTFRAGRLLFIVFIFFTYILLTFCYSNTAFAQAESEHSIALTPDEQAWLRAHPDIILGFADSFEPLLIVNDDGSFSGVFFDILQALNKRLGTNIGLRIDSVPKILEKAQKKEVDGMLSLHPDYADKLGLLPTDGYIHVYPTVFARKEASFTGPTDFTGKNVAIIDKVYFSEDIIQQYEGKADILRVVTIHEGLQKVQNGSVDFFIGLSSNDFTIRKYRLAGLEAKYTFFDYTAKFGFAVRPDWSELVTILNKGIASFSEQEIEAIVSRWIEIPVQENELELTSEEQAWLKAHPTITLGSPIIAPWNFVDEKTNQYKGIVPDYLELNCS